METKDILNIVFSSLSLLFGSGAIMALWDRANLKKRLERERQRVKAERILHGFLLPLKFILDQNRRIHSDLTSTINLRELEYAPDYIQQKIREVFPMENDRRFWFSRLETIMENNEKAFEHFSRVYELDSKFREVSTKLKELRKLVKSKNGNLSSSPGGNISYV